MIFRLRCRKVLSLLLIVCFTSMPICSTPVQAKMVSTLQTLNHSQSNSERDRLNAFLDREDVQKQLEAWGLNKEMAKAGIDRLTDKEVSNLAQQLDQLPAGGDGLGTLVGAAVFIFIVLLITDILGLTDVFSFVKKHR